MKIQEKNKFLKYSTKGYKKKRAKIHWDGIPAFLKKIEPEFSLFNHFYMSVAGHIVGIVVLCLLVFVFKIGVVDPIMKSKDKINDIQFVLDTGKKAFTPKPKTYESSAPAKIDSLLPQKSSWSTMKPSKNAKSAGKVPVASSKAIGEFDIPVPKLTRASGGRGGLSKRSGSSSGGSSYGSSSLFGDEDANGSGSGGSSKGGGFDKNAARNAIASYDISPYVNELKRNVRVNWKPPRDEEGKHVELFLRIAKDGRIVILNVKRTSESGTVDEAALNAVKRTLPLSPLPSKYPKSYLDLIFTFNSNSSYVGSRF